LTDSMSADGMDLVLAMCDSFEERDYDTLVSECGDDVQRWSLAEIFAGDVVGIVFYDEDGSGTLTDGDSFEITEDLDGTLDWNAVRLAKDSAYADENPEVVLPGFTAALGIISMLGAALLVRKNE
ncbi:MAG: PGF-CTERM sorting domain-containing protein, partial [Candidatus Poseidoniales archaeon]